MHDLAVLHYDHDYDRIAADSGLRFRSRWIAAPGSPEAAGEQPQVVRVLKRAVAARLAQFAGDGGDEALHRRVMGLLDDGLDDAGKAPLPPP